jgi:hypothetical protein
MDYRKLSQEALATFTRNIATLLGGTELAAIDSNVRSDLTTAIGTLPATLSTQVADVMTTEEWRKAKVSARNQTQQQIYALLTQVRNALKTGIAPREQFDLCGFDFPAVPVGSYIPRDPGDLAVTGFSNGVNKGGFSGNNTASRVHYEIWRRQGDSGSWELRTVVRKQKFIDTPVSPGQYYEYKVRAVAARAMSNFSNSAVVYGAV